MMTDNLRGPGVLDLGMVKIVFNASFEQGEEGYQMLFTGSKNIDPSQSYRRFNIAKYIQLHCGRTL